MKQYLDVLNKILKNGRRKGGARENMPETIGISHAVIQMNMKDGFPLLTTKKIFIKGIIEELLWMLRGETNIKPLVDKNVNIWNGDAYRWYLKYYDIKNYYNNTLTDNIPDDENEPYSIETFIELIKKGDLHNTKTHIYNKQYKLGDLGNVYGQIWRNIQLNENIQPIPQLKSDLKKTYLGVANGKGKEKHILRKTWEGMISRCYDQKSINYHIYGKRGVFVCDRWLEFNAFAEDVKLIPNWDLKMTNPRKYVLDKDGIGDGFCYSVKTCQWITPSDNSNLINNNIYTLEKNGIQYKFTNISKFCEEHNISNKNISDLWIYPKTGKKRYGFSLVSIESKPKKIDQVYNCIKSLQTNPYSRYHIIDAWDPRNKDISALMPCHLLYQFIVAPLSIDERLDLYTKLHPDDLFVCNDDEQIINYLDSLDVPKYLLDLNMYQRSCDFFLGNSFNLASMSLLLRIIAKTCNMVANEATWIGGDTHLYVDHLPMVEEQLKREPFKLCNININKELNTLEDILSLKFEDFELIDYQSHPTIKAELFTGYKK